jgi:Zn-dependent peptidase ImmA (M78 family)
MIRGKTSELQIAGYVRPSAGWPRWRELTVVLEMEADPGVVWVPISWIDREDGTTVEGVETSWNSLAAEHDDAVERLAPKIRLGDRQRLVLDADGHPEIVSVDDLERERRIELFRHLQAALAAAAENASDDDIEAHIDAAFDVSAFDPLMLTLRAGYLTSAGSARADDALHDLLGSVGDLDALRTVRQRSGWNDLAPVDLRDSWYAAARDAMTSALESNVTEFRPAIARGVRLRAALLALLRARWGFRQPAELAHDLLARGLRGEPRAMQEIDRTLQVSQEWRLWSELITRAEPRAQEEMALAFGEAPIADALLRASREDLLGVAENWYAMEINEDGGRATDWRRTLEGFSQWVPFTRQSPWQNGEHLAERLRARAGLGGRPIASVNALFCDQLGVRPDAASLASDGFGVVGAAPRATPPCIFVDASAHGLAARFAASHALAHLLVDGGRRRAEDVVCACSIGPAAKVDEQERLANAFAMYFIAPRDGVQRRVQRLAPIATPEFIAQAIEVQDEFGLTAVAAAEHLLNCFRVPRAERLPPDVRDELREAQRHRPNEFGRSDQPRPVRQGRSDVYADTVTRLARRGVIAERDAAVLLAADAAA